MKLEFLDHGSPECPLIRLYSFTRGEALRIKHIADQLAAGKLDNVALHDEPGIEPIDGCHLFLKLGKHDVGITQAHPQRFQCVLSDEGWLDVSSLLQPFCETGTSGSQWLVSKGPISLLVSADGKW